MQLLKERGVQKPSKDAAKQAENGGGAGGDDPLLLRVRCIAAAASLFS